MATTVRSALLIVSLALAPVLALAGPCDAFFAFDGSLVDSSGSGHDGRMVGVGGIPAEPVFVDGRSGQALRLDGESAMRTLLDLHPDACPQVTITAWVNVPSGDSTEGYIVSTEGQHGPALRVFGNSVHLVGAKGIERRDVLYPDTWSFVALVYDSENALYRLHFGNRSLEAPMGEILFEPGPATWIGAYDQRMRYAPNGIVVDELRIIGAALDEQRIAALRDSTGSGNADALAQSSDSSLVPGASCSSTAQCPADTYCAVDRTCHPDSHLPMAASGSIGTGPRDIEIDRVTAAPDLTSANESDGIGESSRLSPESEQALTDFMAENRPPEIEYESEEAALAAAERREQERLEEERRREEAEAAAADNDAPDTTIPHPAGNKQYSAVSGTRGNIVRELDLHLPNMQVQGTFDKAWLTGISWQENRDRPCRVRIRGLRPIEYSGGRVHEQWDAVEQLSGCTGGDWIFTQVPGDVSLSQGNPSPLTGGDASAIGRIQVCSNDRNNRRIKGLRIQGTRIRADGSLTVEGNADTTEFPNCRSWAPAVICPANTLGTGLVIHATEASGDNEQIVGLQLICRSISIHR